MCSNSYKMCYYERVRERRQQWEEYVTIVEAGTSTTMQSEPGHYKRGSPCMYEYNVSVAAKTTTATLRDMERSEVGLQRSIHTERPLSLYTHTTMPSCALGCNPALRRLRERWDNAMWYEYIYVHTGEQTCNHTKKVEKVRILSSTKYLSFYFSFPKLSGFFSVEFRRMLYPCTCTVLHVTLVSLRGNFFHILPSTQCTKLMRNCRTMGKVGGRTTTLENFRLVGEMRRKDISTETTSKGNFRALCAQLHELSKSALIQSNCITCT